jgi:GNAT superfamily N-acetyltransferase
MCPRQENQQAESYRKKSTMCDKSGVRPATGLRKHRNSMPAKLPAFTTKELTKKTWPDFERLFSRGNGWDHCQCMHFQRPCPWPKEQWLRSRAERSVRNRREKRELVEHGRAHGILVYANDQPVGWCQYGPKEELPRIDSSRHYRALAPEQGSIHLWRITCFVVDRKHRSRGIATVALQAALESIKKKGGGLVEAFPLIDWDKLRRSEIRRRGHAPSFGNMSTHGTISMFEKQGFETVAPFGSSNMLMRRIV